MTLSIVAFVYDALTISSTQGTFFRNSEEFIENLNEMFYTYSDLHIQ